MEAPLEQRVALANRVREVRSEVVDAASPGLGKADAERACELPEADAGFHPDLLAGAIESGSLEATRDHAAWTARVLACRTRGGLE